MKRFYLSTLLLSAALTSCAVTDDTGALDPDEADLGEAQQAQFCMNNLFPGPGDANHQFSYKPCEGGAELLGLDATTAANLWSHHVTVPGQTLGYLACDEWEESRTHPASITNLSNVTSGSSPAFTWSHLCSHTFLIQRKIGPGSWTTIATLANGSFSAGAVLPYSYQDATVNLSVPHDQIQYAVLNRNYSSESPIASSAKVVFPSTLALSASIAGPTGVLIPAKGQGLQTITWTANVSGGVAPYTYQGTYRGFVAGASSSFSKTYSYVGYNADFSSTLKLTVTDAAGVTKQQTITLIEDSAPYQLD